MGNNLRITEALQALQIGLDQMKTGAELLEDILLDQHMEIAALRDNFHDEKERNYKLKTKILKLLEEDLNGY